MGDDPVETVTIPRDLATRLIELGQSFGDPSFSAIPEEGTERIIVCDSETQPAAIYRPSEHDPRRPGDEILCEAAGILTAAEKAENLADLLNLLTSELVECVVPQLRR